MKNWSNNISHQNFIPNIARIFFRLMLKNSRANKNINQFDYDFIKGFYEISVVTIHLLELMVKWAAKIALLH